MTTSTHLQRTLLVLALASIYPLQVHASAGVAQFIAGDVNVRGADGKTDALQKGRDIESGQAIVTGTNGRAQVKFSDGGLISLQPNTEFKIANYVDKADPKEDRFLVDLLRGSMRAITGLIGKRNRANYKVTTTTATIGIRGSGFSAGYNPDGSLGVTAEKDAIEVCSGGTCVGVVAGESVRVNSSSEAPVRTVNRASVPTPEAAQEVVTVGNQTSSDGSSTLKNPSPPVVVKVSEPIKLPVVRTFTDIQVSAVGSDVSFNTPVLRTAVGATTVFSDNKLTAFTDTSFGTPKWFESGTSAPLSSFKSIGNVTDANFIGWGMWTKGTRDYFGTLLLDHVHYVAGRPTPQADINALLNTGSFTYSLVGSTSPTRNGVTGTLSSATFSVTFASTNYSVNVGVNTSFGNFTDSGTSTTSSFTGTNLFVTGMFIGSNAAFAGMTYAKDPGGGKITGSLVFQKP
ncbi:MAG: FecR domain-containing protein [Polaromonas sp.]